MPTLELTKEQAEILSYIVEDWVGGVEPNHPQLCYDLECKKEDIQKVYDLVTDLLA
jgi:hypothetical protein